MPMGIHKLILKIAPHIWNCLYDFLRGESGKEGPLTEADLAEQGGRKRLSREVEIS